VDGGAAEAALEASVGFFAVVQLFQFRWKVEITNGEDGLLDVFKWLVFIVFALGHFQFKLFPNTT
jgi:hypothetical protein